MTLAEIIAAHQAATVAITPIDGPAAVLTPRGHAAVAAIRLRRQVGELGTRDRAWTARLLRDLAADVESATV
jgi:hypothetical protein